MIKRDELATPDSCLNKASDDEPIFVLRANDKDAPDAVREWAIKYRLRKEALEEWGLLRVRNKYEEAFALAIQMEEWKMKHCQFHIRTPDAVAAKADDTMKHQWKKACEEMNWAVNQAYCANHDRNPNRHAQIDMALQYALNVAIATISGDELPKRPDIKNAV